MTLLVFLAASTRSSIVSPYLGAYFNRLLFYRGTAATASNTSTEYPFRISRRQMHSAPNGPDPV